MCEMRIALTNLGMYNEGTLNYVWLDLPATEEEIEAAKDAININNRYEEWFITDYECDFMSIGEFDSLEELNNIAEALDALDEWERDIVKALIDEGYNLEEAIETAPNCIVYNDCNDMSDVAYQMYEEGLLGEIPDHLIFYIDWEAYGRDLSYDGHWIATDNGYIEVIR